MRLLIAVDVTTALTLSAIVIFGIFDFEKEGVGSAPPAHIEPGSSAPAPTAPANP